MLSQRLRGISFHSNLIKSRRFPRNSAPDATESDLLHPHLHISSTSFALSLTNRGGISPTLVPFPGTIANFSSYRHPSRGVSQPIIIIITTTHIRVTASTGSTILLRSPTGASFIPPYGAAWGLGCNRWISLTPTIDFRLQRLNNVLDAAHSLVQSILVPLPPQTDTLKYWRSSAPLRLYPQEIDGQRPAQSPHYWNPAKQTSPFHLVNESRIPEQADPVVLSCLPGPPPLIGPGQGQVVLLPGSIPYKPQASDRHGVKWPSDILQP